MKISATLALHAAEFIVAIGVLVSSLEILQVRHALRDEGLLSWRIHRLSHPAIAVLVNRLHFESLLRYPGILTLICLRLFMVIVLAALVLTNRSTLIPMLIISTVTLTMTLRSPQGNDGSDQMASVILVASTLAEGVATEFARSLALVFIAAQAALAYGTSGFLKLGVAGWHDGTFVIEILKTSSFGNKNLLRYVLTRQYLARLLGWGVVCGDCALSVALLLPPPLCFSLLGIGVVLHVGIAFVLGLNTFFWSFVATYPAILWVSESVYRKMLR